MSKQYDKVLKENIEQIFLPLAEKYLGIKIIKTESLPDKIQVTEEREPDYNKIVLTDREKSSFCTWSSNPSTIWKWCIE